MRPILETLRPKQWIKNLVIFAGLVFDGQLLNLQPFLRVLFATLIFCLISGLTYTLNDLFDIKADRLHPQKKNRPIASGRLSVQHAILLAVILALIAFPAAFLLSIEFGWVCLTYTLLILAYSKWLKKILILDVMIIAFGFVLRVIAGVVVITVNYFSPWLFLITTLLAIFLGFGKRLSELKMLETHASEHRNVLAGYSIPLLKDYINIVLCATLITYCLYTFSAHPAVNTYAMMFTIPFVLYGLFRYMYIIENSHLAAAPEEALLRDRPLQLVVLFWALAVVVIIYFIY